VSQLIIEIVTTPEHAEELRRLRNECRESMTRDTAEITPEQQREFLAGPLRRGTARAYLLRTGPGEAAVAYGMLRDDGDHLWLSCGVTEAERGSGLGVLMVRFLTASAGRGPVRLEVRQDNEPARRVYEKAGYAVTGSGIRDGRVFELMEHP
jgi:ribosomal protein S18 acetylase RimI-like enzyme